MNYLPVEPKSHEYKHAESGERQRRRMARAIGLGAVATVALLVGFGTWTHSSRSAAAVGVLEARINAVPNVLTMAVTEDREPRTDTATLFARATGYISVRNVDIGSKVLKGDVLAVIAAPELDRQLDQAKAQLAPVAGGGRAGSGQCRSWPCYNRAHFATRCQGCQVSNRAIRTGCTSPLKRRLLQSRGPM
jgi:hypothetical protein